MENQQQTKLQPGAWAHMTAYKNREDIKWELDKGHTVTFIDDEPQELTNNTDQSVFYKFNVVEGGAEKSITTSAKTLLGGIKGLGDPLKGRSAIITKRTAGGKQWYEVVQWEGEGTPAVPEETVA